MVKEFLSVVLYFHEFHNQIMNCKEPIFYPACNLKNKFILPRSTMEAAARI